MAEQLPLNTFKSVTFNLTTASQQVYTVPDNVTSIILGTQAANTSLVPATITAELVKTDGLYTILNDFVIPPNDAANIINGKLIMESGSALVVSASSDLSIDLVISLLETSNV